MKKLLSNRGMGLTSTIIGLGLTGIIVYVMMNVASNQAKNIKRFEQKSEAIQLQDQIYQVLKNTNICEWQFASTTTGQRLNTVATNADGTLQAEITFTELYRGTDPSTAKLVEVGQSFAGAKVSDITLKRLQATGVTGQFSGELFVNFDKDTTALGLAPAISPLTISIDTTTGSPTSRNIISCRTTGNSINDICRSLRSGQFTADAVVWCDTDYPKMFSCNIIDNQAPSVGPTLMTSCLNNGPCNFSSTRGNLGQDNAYLERIAKNVTGQVVEGCAQYDQGHSRDPYKLEIYCCK